MLRSVAVALRVFEILAEQQPIGVSELSRQVHLPKSTVQRCLRALAMAGWIHPGSAPPTRWMITEKALNLGRRVGDAHQLRLSSMPIMRRLRETSQMTVHLAVPAGRDAVLVEHVLGPEDTLLLLPMGARGPLHAMANGKAMLSRFAPDRLTDYLNEGLRAVTRHTIVEPERLRREIQGVAVRGWAISSDEVIEGQTCVASAISDRNGRPLASISVNYPTARFTQAEQARQGRLVSRAALEIGVRLVGRAAPEPAA
jgi:DNA-binding IclR family transcriptional regulator